MISIIIPTYNRAKFLPRAIESVVEQSFSDWELIISDDGSTDNTATVVGNYLEDNRIKYIENINKGATAARNAGARIASGEFITFLDSDDEAFPNWLAEFNKEIEKGNKVICCGYEYVDHKGFKLRENFPLNMGPLYGNRVGRFTNGGVFLIKKTLFDEIGGYDEKVKAGQHSELAIRLFQLLDKKNITIKNIFKPLIKVHVHNEEKIRNDHKALYEGMIYTLEKHHSIFSQHKSLLINYLRVGAVSAFRIGKEKEANKLFFRAWTHSKWNLKSLAQFALSSIPTLGRKVWNKKE